MSTTEEATVNPDGSTTFETPPVNETEGAFDDSEQEGFEDAPPIEEEIVKGIDPAFYLLAAVVVAAFLYYFMVYRKKKKEETDEFFSNLDGEKVSQRLRAQVLPAAECNLTTMPPPLLIFVHSSTLNFLKKSTSTIKSEKSVKRQVGSLENVQRELVHKRTGRIES